MIMYFGNSFGAARMLFALVGISFALIKVSVYSMIGLVTKNENEHSSLMSSIEGVFMFGIALAYFLFPAFNNDDIPNQWLNVYLLLAAISLLSFLFLWFTPFDVEKTEIKANETDFYAMLNLMAKVMVIVFLLSAFLFVMIEQGIMTWLPTFNKEVIKLSTNVSIMMASILAISLGAGRIIAGVLAKKVKPIYLISACILASITLVLFVLPKTANLAAVSTEINTFSDIPLIAFVFPLVGLFIAPIYPLLNSAVLSALSKSLHAPMTGLIVIFSALGGTLGSRIVGYTFKTYGAEKGFYFTVIPLVLLLIAVFYLEKLKKR
jgi:fucose permease